MKDFNISIDGLTENPIKFWINGISKVRENIPEIEKQLPAVVSKNFKTFQEQIYKAINQRPDFKETREYTDNFFLVLYASYLTDCLTYSFSIQKYIKQKEAIKQMIIAYSQNYFRLASITTALLTDGETLKEAIQKLTDYQDLRENNYRLRNENEKLKQHDKRKSIIRAEEIVKAYLKKHPSVKATLKKYSEDSSIKLIKSKKDIAKDIYKWAEIEFPQNGIKESNYTKHLSNADLFN